MLFGLPSGAFHTLSSGVQAIIRAVERIHELGFQVAELHADVEAFYPGRLRTAVINFKVPLKYTVHLPFVAISPGSRVPEIREASLKIVERIVSAVRRIEPIHYVIHPLSIGEEKAIMTMFSPNELEELTDRLLEMHEAIGDYVGVHNRVLVENSELIPIERRMNYVEDYGFYGCFDVGHAVLQGYDPLEVLERVGKYVREIHLHDVVSSRRSHGSVKLDHMPPGSGVVSFTEIIEYARKLGIPVVIFEVFNPQYAELVAEWAKKHGIIRRAFSA